MASIYVKWNEGEGSVQVPVGYYGNRKEIATAQRHNGYVTATMNDCSESFSSETMKGLKQQILEHYHAQQNEMVEKFNPFTGKMTQVRKGDLGGPLDHTTEQYHSA